MEPGLASLLVRAPDEREWYVELKGDRVTVGRPTPASRPDVALEPDTQRWVSRVHCTLEHSGGTWTLNDNATMNGTLLRRNGVTERISGPVVLTDDDTFCILGSLTADGEPLYWQLTYQTEPWSTNQAPTVVHEPVVEYDFVQARVFRREGAARTEIMGLRPKAHQLIRYMAGASRSSGGSAVACSYEELIRALWGELEEWPAHRSYTIQDLRDIALDVRKRLEVDPRQPRLLQTVRGYGYRLAVSPERADELADAERADSERTDERADTEPPDETRRSAAGDDDGDATAAS